MMNLLTLFKRKSQQAPAADLTREDMEAISDEEIIEAFERGDAHIQPNEEATAFVQGWVCVEYSLWDVSVAGHNREFFLTFIIYTSGDVVFETVMVTNVQGYTVRANTHVNHFFREFCTAHPTIYEDEVRRVCPEGFFLDERPETKPEEEEEIQRKEIMTFIGWGVNAEEYKEFLEYKKEKGTITEEEQKKLDRLQRLMEE